MSNFFLSVNTRFGSVPSVISRRISLRFWALMATWLAVSSWQCRIVKGFTPRSSLNTWCMMGLLTQRLRWPRFCSFVEGFVAAFPSCFWGVEGSGYSVFLHALVGQGCFQSPGTSARCSTPLNGSYPAVLHFQHYLVTLLWSLIIAF